MNDILQYFQNQSLKTYKSVNYKAVEISQNLSLKLEQRLLHSIHKNKYLSNQIEIINGSIFYYTPSTQEPVFIIGMEILDNMPHDRLWKQNDELKYESVVTEDLKEER